MIEDAAPVEHRQPVRIEPELRSFGPVFVDAGVSLPPSTCVDSFIPRVLIIDADADPDAELKLFAKAAAVVVDAAVLPRPAALLLPLTLPLSSLTGLLTSVDLGAVDPAAVDLSFLGLPRFRGGGGAGGGVGKTASSLSSPPPPQPRLAPLSSEATYFLNVDVAPLGEDDDVAFCRRLVLDHGVAAIPVSAFYASGAVRTLVRFCFAKRDATLDAALERLAGLRRLAA